MLQTVRIISLAGIVGTGMSMACGLQWRDTMAPLISGANGRLRMSACGVLEPMLQSASQQRNHAPGTNPERDACSMSALG